MDPQSFDQFARSCAASASRRAVIRRLAALIVGGAILTTRPTPASATHRSGHCTKPGKKCHKHKECCGGLCAADGVCRSCAGVVAWGESTLAHIATIQTLATSVLGDIASMAEDGFSREVVDGIGASAGAFGQIQTHLQTDLTPPAALDPLRTLLEALAAMADALSAYLEQVAEESYLETGDRATGAISTTLTELPTIQAEIAALCETCRGT